MNVVKATAKGQVLIPAPLRRKYKIERGTPLRVYGKKNQIVLERGVLYTGSIVMPS